MSAINKCLWGTGGCTCKTQCAPVGSLIPTEKKPIYQVKSLLFQGAWHDVSKTFFNASLDCDRRIVYAPPAVTAKPDMAAPDQQPANDPDAYMWRCAGPWDICLAPMPESIRAVATKIIPIWFAPAAPVEQASAEPFAYIVRSTIWGGMHAQIYRQRAFTSAHDQAQCYKQWMEYYEKHHALTPKECGVWWEITKHTVYDAASIPPQQAPEPITFPTIAMVTRNSEGKITAMRVEQSIGEVVYMIPSPAPESVRDAADAARWRFWRPRAGFQHGGAGKPSRMGFADIEAPGHSGSVLSKEFEAHVDRITDAAINPATVIENEPSHIAIAQEKAS